MTRSKLSPEELHAARVRAGKARAAQASAQAARIKGGKARAAQADFIDACRKGFASTMERHPNIAVGLLRGKIRAFNVAKAAALGISYRQQRARARSAASLAETAALVAYQASQRAAWAQGPAMPAGSLWG